MIRTDTQRAAGANRPRTARLPAVLYKEGTDMLKLRPYKRCDADSIAAWVRDEDIFRRWGGDRFGVFPVTADMIDGKYRDHNGDCAESDNFYPWTATDESGRPVGHFIMRYTGGDRAQLRFGWVVVDSAFRGKGCGKQMLTLGLKYAFEFLAAERVTIGVFENNTPAYRCYRSVGFTETETVAGKPWNVIEMEMLKKDYVQN